MLRTGRRDKTMIRRVSTAILVILLAGSLSYSICAAANVQDETEAETEVTLTKAKDFLADIGAAENDRLAISQSYTEAELRMMTNDEIAQANQECCESERWFVDRYTDAQFASRNLQYLCEQYLTGLQNQFDAYDSWQEKQDIDAYNELWEAGFAKRAVVVVELKEFYGVGFTDISDMQKKADELQSLDTFSSGGVSAETVRKVQEYLNKLKFPVGAVDGDCGYRTVQMVRRFQKLYGYNPSDGIIDDELVSQLEEEVEKASAKKRSEKNAEQTEEAVKTQEETEQEETITESQESAAETETEAPETEEKVRLG